MRCVIDTNILIRHLLLPNSLPAQAVRHALRRDVIITSDALMLELGVTISRAKFDAYLSPEKRREFLHQFQALAEPVAIVSRIHACRDANDNMVLEAAVNGRADSILSGDKDLLVLHPFRGIRICNAADYLAANDF